MNVLLMGTPGYISPEGILNYRVGKKSDIWSLGVIAYQLYVFSLPFNGNNASSLFDSILDSNIIYPANLSLLSKKFIKALLVRDPKKRPSIEEVMKHEYFESINWDTFYKKKYVPPSFSLKNR